MTDQSPHDEEESLLSVDDETLIGLDVVDINGQKLGIVAEVEEVRGTRRVVLNRGTAYPLYAMTVGAEALIVDRAAMNEANEGVVDASDPDARPPEAIAAGPEGYVQDFRAHFDATYAGAESQFTSYEPAYKFGYGLGGTERNQQRSFEDVEDEIRAKFEEVEPHVNYAHVREAVRYGYERIQEDRA